MQWKLPECGGEEEEEVEYVEVDCYCLIVCDIKYY